jgi:hypothetical protein
VIRIAACEAAAASTPVVYRVLLTGPRHRTDGGRPDLASRRGAHFGKNVSSGSCQHKQASSSPAESTAEKYSSQRDPERALSTASSALTSAKTFRPLPAASSQPGVIPGPASEPLPQIRCRAAVGGTDADFHHRSARPTGRVRQTVALRTDVDLVHLSQRLLQLVRVESPRDDLGWVDSDGFAGVVRVGRLPVAERLGVAADLDATYVPGSHAGEIVDHQ